MDMDTTKDRLVVKIRLRKRDDPAGLIDSLAITTIRHLSERKLASRDCSLRRAVLIQKALPFLDTPCSPPPAPVVTEEHPWDRDPPCFDAQPSEGIMLPSIEDDLDSGASYAPYTASAVSGTSLLFHSSEDRDYDWYDQQCSADADLVSEPMLSSTSSLSASMEDDEETEAVVTVAEQRTVCISDEEEESEDEEAVRALFRRFSGTPRASPASVRKQSTNLGKRSRYGEDEDEVDAKGEECEELSQFSALAQAEPLKCSKPTRTASPCGMTRRAATPSSPCSSFAVLSMV